MIRIDKEESVEEMDWEDQIAKDWIEGNLKKR